MRQVIQDIYENTSEFLRTFGAFQLFFLRLLRYSPGILVSRFDLVVKQVYNTGALSLVIVMVCGLFVGAVILSLGFVLYGRWLEPVASAPSGDA